ncbi:MAG: class I SAM-dependent methyltransferase [Archangium sp.]|nr:class I SAM-dependent methyltransferase [Archangium sp.]
MTARQRFDDAYYRRYYLDAKTRIYAKERQWSLAAATFQMCDWLGLKVDTVLDVGAGVGWWGQWIRANRPSVKVVSTEFEADTCKRYGHVQADIGALSFPEPFDLVICQGVLPYVDARTAKRGIANLAKACNGLLYLEAITANDTRGASYESLSDLQVHRRTGEWYRAQLEPHFQQLGLGYWSKRESGLVFYELETPAA